MIIGAVFERIFLSSGWKYIPFFSVIYPAVFTCFKSTIEKPEQCEKSIQNYLKRFVQISQHFLLFY